jgi:hypothetical protein
LNSANNVDDDADLLTLSLEGTLIDLPNTLETRVNSLSLSLSFTSGTVFSSFSPITTAEPNLFLDLYRENSVIDQDAGDLLDMILIIKCDNSGNLSTKSTCYKVDVKVELPVKLRFVSGAPVEVFCPGTYINI